MKMQNVIKIKEFIAYFGVGATTTILDWSLFWFYIHKLGLHYEFALIFTYIPLSIFHFFCNKIVTFQCKSNQLASQYSLYIVLTLFSLVISMAVIALLVNIFLLDKMFARIATTAIMLLPNYLLHKNITFSRSFFQRRSAVN